MGTSRSAHICARVALGRVEVGTREGLARRKAGQQVECGSIAGVINRRQPVRHRGTEPRSNFGRQIRRSWGANLFTATPSCAQRLFYAMISEDSTVRAISQGHAKGVPPPVFLPNTRPTRAGAQCAYFVLSLYYSLGHKKEINP